MSRSIEKPMIDFIDSKLASNGLAQKAITEGDARLVFMLAMQCLVGIREVGGNNEGPMVELIQKTIGGAGKEAWCMAGIQTGLAYAEHKTGKVSPIPASEHCMTVFKGTPAKFKVKKIPAPGAIAIWNYPPKSNGHTGVVMQYRLDAGKMNLVECNTEAGLNKSGTIERDGGGVYYTERSIKGTSKMVLKGFLIPF